MLRVTRQPGLGGEFGGEWIYVYVWLSLCCSPETITTLLISYTPIQNKKLKAIFFFKVALLLNVMSTSDDWNKLTLP